ncbi:MAG: HAD family hydrolase [bacterium]
MKPPKPTMALIYDFDGTLAPGNMQEYDFFPDIQQNPRKFWAEVKSLAKQQNADEILIYLYLMLKRAQEKTKSIHRNTFKTYGKSIKLFPGVEEWFDQITKYANEKNIKLEHYIVSSGLYEMIEGTSIFKKFKTVFASSFLYSPDNTAFGPALAVNYTTKTQFIFRINKGIFNAYDNSKINKFIKEEERYIPFRRMVYLGDGETDVPCMSLIKAQGGFSIAVYKKKTKGAKEKAQKLFEEGRVNAISPADYSISEKLDGLVKAVIDRVAAHNNLQIQIDSLLN